MENCSYFIENKAIFGSYPTQDIVDELEEKGVRYFVNLTYDTESGLIPYRTRYKYIHYNIMDFQVPTNWRTYSVFILELCKIINNLKNDEIVYIHCKGGHGRSGVVVASLLCNIYGMTSENALENTKKYHNNRLVMKDKSRKIGSPQTSYQKKFVHKFFEPLIFNKIYKKSKFFGFSNFSEHSVVIDDLGEFYNAEAAIQAYKNPSNKDYVKLQETIDNPGLSANLGRRIELRTDWYSKIDELLFIVVKNKFEQHPELLELLLNTGLRPLIYQTKRDIFFGNGVYGNGLNKLGEAIMKVREYFYLKDIVNS